MKKQLHQLVSTYFLKSSLWLMTMLLALSLLPVALKSTFMLIRQNALPFWMVVLSDLAGWIAAWILLFTAVWHMEGHSRTKFVKGLWKTTIKGGLWLVAAAALTDTAYRLFLTYGSRLAVQGLSLVYTLAQLLMILLISLLMSSVIFWLICMLADPEYGTTFPGAFLLLLRKPLLLLGSVPAAGLVLFAIPLLYDYLLKIVPGLSLSFMEIISGAVILALLQWSILQPVLDAMFRTAVSNLSGLVKNQSGTKEASPADPAVPEVSSAAGAAKPVPFVLRYISVLAALAMIAASGIYALITGSPLSPVSAVKKDIGYYINYGKLMSKAGDPASAAYYERIAEARVLAWQGIARNDNNLLVQAVNLAPSDEQVLLLHAAGNPGALEQGLLNSDHSQAWYLALLNEYAKAGGSLSDIQRQRRSELLRICILQGYYCKTSVLPEDVAADPESFDRMLGDFKDEIVAGKQYALIARVGEDGGITRQLAMDALDLAEKNPLCLELQYLAMSYGASWQEDNASHYGRTADAALRYDGLFMQKKAKKASEKEIIQEKITVAKTLLTCKQTKTAEDFLSTVTYKSTELSALRASCLFALKAYDKCLETASELLKDSPESPQALYLAANSTLRLGRIEDSLKYAGQLAGLVEKGKNKVETESLLYPYLLRFTINDGAGRYTTETYSRLTEAQMNIMKDNEFFYNYMTAASLWAKNNNESRTAALALLDKVLASGGKLSRAQYIKGAIYFELGDNEKALENLKASVAIDEEQPAAWYALANLYDRMQKYEESYSACQKVLKYLPSTDHAYDVFGISVHTSGLMDKLKPYVKEVD